MAEFTLGARASCPDGFCGVVSRTILDLAEETELVDAVPLGDIEVERHESVHAKDGHIGQVEGFVVDPADQKVTHVLLKEGHPWGHPLGHTG
jgi:predicted nucleotidyltransferase